MRRLVFFSFVFIILFVGSAFASNHLPANLLKIIEHNNQATQTFALQISFAIAFVAGVLGVLSPCILPFLPAYFSYTFKEKKNITGMTLIFFFGFALVFVAMGVVAGFVGEQTINALQERWLVTLAGLVLLGLGVMTLLGKGFGSFFSFSTRFSQDISGTFLFGMTFALGWTACLGPILSGILAIGALLGNVWHAALLLFFYALGNLVPLFLLSFFYDSFKIGEKKWIKGRMIIFHLFGREYEVHSTSIIAGVMFIVFGIVLIVFGNTAIVNTLDLLGTKEYFYLLQNKLIVWEYASLLGGVALAMFALVLGYFLWKGRRR